MGKTLILCDCGRTQQISAEAIGAACGIACTRVFTALCTDQIDSAAALLAPGGVLVACAQESAVFADLAEDIGAPVPGFVDLRDRAGWSDAGVDAAPKMAALVAEAMLPVPAIRTIDVGSDGSCLIFGPGAAVEPLARQLCDTLAVTALYTDAAEAPVDRDFDMVQGRLRRIDGALGGFAVRIDGFRQVVPGGRGAFAMTAPRDGAVAACDIVIDLAGGAPMVAAAARREGYLRADPRDPLAVARLAGAAVQLVGTFEKPLHVRLEASLCAHARAGKIGCSRCLDHCPTGAIVAAGDHVAIDPMICAGCGACAALCPSGAITGEAPPLGSVLGRMRVLARTYRAAGGSAPRLLVHDAHGAGMIRLAARFGRGLPAEVIPMELPVVSGFGHAEMLAALAQGFAEVAVLLAPTTERDALASELALAQAIAGPGRLALLDQSDPDALADALRAGAVAPPLAVPVLPMGNRRQVTRLAALALRLEAGAPVALPAGAPYGAVRVDTDACTLCLACVSLCPSGALTDNPDRPQLRFQEDACLQCGICAAACPERAIALEPRLALGESALRQVVLHEEDPFACIECGKPFGVRSSIERIVQKLAGTHPMFATSAQARLIRMCDDCRVNAQFHSADNPFAGGERARPRTTEDYLSDREDH